MQDEGPHFQKKDLSLHYGHLENLLGKYIMTEPFLVLCYLFLMFQIHWKMASNDSHIQIGTCLNPQCIAEIGYSCKTYYDFTWLKRHMSCPLPHQ